VRARAAALALAALVVAGGCGTVARDARTVVTISGSTVGSEGALLARQVARFMRLHPQIVVRVQRTPDDATQRHQLYVQWLNARAGDPDVLQLDVVWTPEFAAAEWLLPLGRFAPATEDFFPATIAANRWAGELYGLPWFVDVGLLYWRTDLLPHEPRSLDELVTLAEAATQGAAGVPYGIVWQGARYEGLVTVFLEYLGGFGGRITDDAGRAVVDSPEAVRALTFLRDQLHTRRVAPVDVLTWHEEEVRFAFQNGRAAVMRNWPYAYAPLSDTRESRSVARSSPSTRTATCPRRPTPSSPISPRPSRCSSAPRPWGSIRRGSPSTTIRASPRRSPCPWRRSAARWRAPRRGR
jgi:multiple sugar transport system substrate-binding protein